MDDTKNKDEDNSDVNESYINESDDDTLLRSYDKDFPTTIEEFGYKFNQFGQLRHVTTNEPYEFNVKKDDLTYNQKRYEALGELMTDYVYNLLVTEGGLKKTYLPLDAKPEDPKTFIFHSPDAFTNDRVIILIHGSGVVRAGQWARRLIINDSLNSGTQLPYIKRAKGLGYGVIVLNTNDNKRDMGSFNILIKGNENPEHHSNYVWKNLIIPVVAAKHIAIVAHSYGGVVTVNLCKSFPESFQKRVFAIAFTDSCHSLVNQALTPAQITWFCGVARNWVVSQLPLNSHIASVPGQEVECYSAGTQRHDLTSWNSFAPVYEFIDAKYSKALQKEL